MTPELHELEGPVLLLAAPGTGKTYSLAQRIKFLVEELSTDRDKITVITFTRAAADNMQLRISDPGGHKLFVPPNLQPRTICTMHSLGNRIIRDRASDLGLPVPTPVVRPEFTRKMLMKDAAQLAGYSRSDAMETFECRQFGDCLPKDVFGKVGDAL